MKDCVRFEVSFFVFHPLLIIITPTNLLMQYIASQVSHTFNRDLKLDEMITTNNNRRQNLRK